jgi:tetratricopeptide (TPR) repeat protein
MKPSSRAALLCIAILLGGAWLWWLCQRDNGIPFLAENFDSRWILYPKPLDSIPHRVAPISTIFKKSFRIDRSSSIAIMSIRCFTAGNVTINGQSVSNLILDGSDWKKTRSVDVRTLLRDGENEILVTVTNSAGPPVLWSILQCDGVKIASDSTWQASCLGAAWQNAAFAYDPPIVRPGNPLFGRERIAESLRRNWVALVIIALVAGLISFAATHYAPRTKWQWLRDPPLIFAVALILLWAVLFCNNLPQLAPLLGFDRDGHLQYIDYILQKKSLPLADDGWQMYQPPLFYVLSALMLAPFDSSASSDSAILALRGFCVFTAVIHLLLIFLCLRLLFPVQPRHQIVGLLVTTFLPANLCLAHNITNETLAALFVTAALYFSLRIFRSNRVSLNLHIAVGICLGLAMLTKFSALLAIPPICAALWWKACESRAVGGQNSEPRATMIPAGLAIIACLLVCGWHYARVWVHFGNPLIGNWDLRLPFAWWQEPGYRMSGWYYRFGETFSCPLFSNLNSFGDGLYSTLWGDGLCSGSARMTFRPPWNYDLMNFSYLLALIPCVLLLIGLTVLIARLIRKPEIGPFLSVSFVGLYGAGILFMTLRVASFAQVKAFYALPALLPVCFLCVVGWDFLARYNVIWNRILTTGMVAWAVTVYACLWIRPSNPLTHLVRGVGFADDKRYAEAIKEFSFALRLAPNDADAYAGLLDSLNRSGNREEARRQAQVAIQACPNEPAVQMQMGGVLGLDGKYDEAIERFREALRLAPDTPAAYLPLTTCLTRLGKMPQAVQAVREGLRVNPFDADLHRALAAAYGSIGDLTNEVAHLRVVTQLKSDSIEMLNNLAWILASTSNANIRNGPEAVQLAERACALTQRREPVLLGTLAAAYAAAGRFKEAVETAEEARDKAITAGQNDVAKKNGQLLDLYRAGKAYHEEIDKP